MREVRAGRVSVLYNPRRNRLPGLRMNVTDYLVIAAVVISAVVGAMRGFLREAVALVAWLLALFIAWHFADLVEPHLGGLLAGSAVKPWAARIIIVLLILLLGAAVGSMLAHFVRLSIFSGMDRFLGLIFGLFTRGGPARRIRHSGSSAASRGRALVDPVPADPVRRIRGERVAFAGWRATGTAFGRLVDKALSEAAEACAVL